MSVKIKVNINHKTAEIEGYGIVHVRPLGAGEELRLTELSQEIAELGEPIAELQANAASPTPEDKAKVEEISTKISKAQKEMFNLVAGRFSSDDETVAKRLTNELPLGELQRIAGDILANA